MSAGICFHDLAQQVRGLLDCDAVSLLLGCPEEELRHPLLDLIPAVESCDIACYAPINAADLTRLLHVERVRALCDMALQSGQMQSIDPTQIPGIAGSVQSIAAVPLECPAGLLGLLLLVDHRSNAFCSGDRLLLESYLPLVAQRLEKDLRHLGSQVNQRTAEEEKEKYPQGVLSSSENDPHEFISMVSHELRTPLSAIKGYAGLLQAYGIPAIPGHPGENCAGEMTPARQQQYLNSIMDQTNHLEVLISDLLDVSRLHTGRLALHPTEVNMALLCQRVVQLMQHRADQQEPEKHCIRCIFAPELPLIWADPDRVQQVLMNLLDNAIKYSPGGGLIEVLVSAHQSQTPLMVHVTVRDQGIGISPKHQALLFKPFSRLEHPTADPIPGVGLGLYITRKLVEIMGGKITLTSSEGIGTSVSFTLPAAQPGHTCPPDRVPQGSPLL